MSQIIIIHLKFSIKAKQRGLKREDWGLPTCLDWYLSIRSGVAAHHISFSKILFLNF